MNGMIPCEVDVPDGFEAVAFRVPLPGETWLSPRGHVLWGIRKVEPRTQPRLILRKVEPKRESVWRNIYGPNVKGFQSRASADDAVCPGRVAVIRLDFEDGKYVGCESEQL